MSRQGRSTNANFNILEVERAWRSPFLDSPIFNGVSRALAMLTARGVREAFLLPCSFPDDSLTSVSATEIYKGPNRFVGFFFV